MSALAKLALALALVIALGGAFFGYGDYKYNDGVKSGTNTQKVADQKQFDTVNAALTGQKTEANDKYRKLADQALADKAAVDEFKHNLEKSNAQAKADVETLRRKYAGVSLRFTTTAKAAGCGNSGGGTQGGQGTAASPNATVTVQLPDQIDGNLKQLTVDGDSLNADYKKCVAWVNR